VLWLGGDRALSYLDPEATQEWGCTLWGSLIRWALSGTSRRPSSGWSCVPYSHGRSNTLIL